MRLIDADAFIVERRRLYCENCERRKNRKGKIVCEVGGVPCRACYIGDVIDDVDSAPTVDAVPVVRCGECKEWDEENHWCNIRDSYGWDYKPNDYCSYGVRRCDDE